MRTAIGVLLTAALIAAIAAGAWGAFATAAQP